MTTVFIWNNCEVSAKLNRFLRGLKKSWGKDQWSHTVTGHSSLLIDDKWLPPFVSENLDTAKDLLMKYDTERRAYNKEDELSSKGFKHKLQMDTYEETIKGLLTDQRENYVSWWPADSGTSSHSRNALAKFWNKHFKTTFDEDKAKAACPYVNIWQDLLEEGYAPDHVLRIPADITQTAAMLKKWKEEKAKRDGKPSYRLYYKNCSRMAARILLAGFNSELSLGTRMACKLRNIWTPLQVKRIGAELIKKIEGAQVLLWKDWVDEVVVAGALSIDAGTALKGLRRRASVRGSSGADARYKYDDSGKLLNKEEADKKLKNTAGFLAPLLGAREAHNLGYIYSLSSQLNDAEFEAMQDMQKQLEELKSMKDHEEEDELGPSLGLFEMEDSEESGMGGDMAGLFDSEEELATTTQEDKPKGGLFGSSMPDSGDPMDDILSDMMGSGSPFF